MRDDQDENAFIERRPAEDVVLAQRPVLVEAALEMHEVTALTQAHFLRKACQLIQVRRIVGNTPNTGLRQIV
jgi:hypothetical protein